jgi:hypothetical protein
MHDIATVRERIAVGHGGGRCAFSRPAGFSAAGSRRRWRLFAAADPRIVDVIAFVFVASDETLSSGDEGVVPVDGSIEQVAFVGAASG